MVTQLITAPVWCKSWPAPHTHRRVRRRIRYRRGGWPKYLYVRGSTECNEYVFVLELTPEFISEACRRVVMMRQVTSRDDDLSCLTFWGRDVRCYEVGYDKTPLGDDYEYRIVGKPCKLDEDQYTSGYRELHVTNGYVQWSVSPKYGGDIIRSDDVSVQDLWALLGSVQLW